MTLWEKEQENGPLRLSGKARSEGKLQPQALENVVPGYSPRDAREEGPGEARHQVRALHGLLHADHPHSRLEFVPPGVDARVPADRNQLGLIPRRIAH